MAKIPEFKDDLEESEFWDTHNSTQYLEETTPVDTRFVGPRPRKVHITLRLDQETIDNLKVLAEHRGVGYQTLIRMWIMEQLAWQSQTQAAPGSIETSRLSVGKLLDAGYQTTEQVAESISNGLVAFSSGLSMFNEHTGKFIEQTVQSFQISLRDVTSKLRSTDQVPPSVSKSALAQN